MESMTDEDQHDDLAGGAVSHDVRDHRRPIEMLAHFHIDAARPQLIGEPIEAAREEAEIAAQENRPGFRRERVTAPQKGGGRVPANVARAINYYQRGGWGLALVAEAGFRGKLVNNDLAADMTISHFNIADNDDIHTDVLHEVDALLQANEQAAAQTIPLPRRRRR
jgi:hypothetical protein